jgi:protocatechuate 3,4-dioxygenase beta subunit
MKMERVMLVGVMVFVTTACAPSESYGQADPFWLRSWNEAQEGRPSTMTSSARIAEESEPGTPFVILGQVFEPDGTPADGVVVHAYHRDRDGFDFGPNDESLTTWRLQGWVETDAEGRFEFHTIRPAPDHLGREGAHIHFTLESTDYGRQWAPTVYLADDPLVSSDQHRRLREAGEFGWVQEVETKNGVQQVRVMIRLMEDSDF